VPAGDGPNRPIARRVERPDERLHRLRPGDRVASVEHVERHGRDAEFRRLLPKLPDQRRRPSSRGGGFPWSNAGVGSRIVAALGVLIEALKLVKKR
jgi:hypothetical protein